MPLDPQTSHISAEARHETSRYSWFQKLTALVFIVFCFELGVFLLVFPWLEYWDRNFFSAITPEWRRYWENGYVRGAVSGVGALNLYIAVLEIFRLRRFSSP